MWQKRLRLQDWHITIEAKRREAIRGEADGIAHFTYSTKEARIYICEPIDGGKERTGPFDFEQVLIHELLHLHFAGCSPADDNSKEHLALEQAIDLTAWALLKAYKGKRGR